MKRHSGSAVVGSVLLLTTLLAAAPAAEAAPVESYGLVFVCDGAKGDVFYDYAVNGRNGEDILPNVRRYFIEGGAWVKEATGVFPTITGAGMPSVLTGCFPGRNDMPSLYFFSRKDKKYPVLYVPLEAFEWNEWLSPDVKTIWEHFTGPNDAISFGPALSRGSDSHVPIVWNLRYKPMELRGKLAVGWRSLSRKVAGGLPARLTVVYNGWFDHMEHGFGATSDELTEHYRQVDRQIGETMEAFLAMVRARQAQGVEVRHFATLVSDHGHQDIRKVESIDRFVREQKGARVLDKVWRRLFGVKLRGDVPDDFSPYDLVVASGEGHALLYFPMPIRKGDVWEKDWNIRPPLSLLRKYPYRGEEIDIVATAVAAEAVSFMVGKDRQSGLVHVYGKSGEATIERSQEAAGEFYRYSVVTGEDPLGFASGQETKHLVDGQLHSGREWQLATLGTEYPDAPVMLYQVFDSRERSADLFLSAAPYVSIGDLVDGEKSKSKHGGLTKDEAWATLAFHGSGITPGLVPTARNVDMVPTLLSLMEHDFDPSALDGEAVPEVLERVRSSRRASVPAAEVQAARQAVEEVLEKLASADDAALPGLAGALQSLLARPGLDAGWVQSRRTRAYAVLARRDGAGAAQVLRGELAGEFLAHRRPDLAGSSGALDRSASPVLLEALTRDVASAAYRSIFEALQRLFDGMPEENSPEARSELARIDSLVDGLIALHDANFPVPAPKLGFETQRPGTNLWLDGLEPGPSLSETGRTALSEFQRIETARAEGRVRRVFFDAERARIQLAVASRLQRLADALAKESAGRALDPAALSATMPPGFARQHLEALAAYGSHAALPGSSAGTATRAGGASNELDEIYQGMGAR